MAMLSNPRLLRTRRTEAKVGERYRSTQEGWSHATGLTLSACIVGHDDDDDDDDGRGAGRATAPGASIVATDLDAESWK
jgi:hypothetical protein